MGGRSRPPVWHQVIYVSSEVLDNSVFALEPFVMVKSDAAFGLFVFVSKSDATCGLVTFVIKSGAAYDHMGYLHL